MAFASVTSTAAPLSHGSAGTITPLASAPATAESAAVRRQEHPLLARLRDMAAERPLVVAHRGASGDYPENTMPAFERALEVQADMVELDFFASRDGVLVCFHDSTLKRTTDAAQVLGNGDLKVREVTLKDLRRLDAGRWKNARFAGTRIPTLEEALERIQSRSITMVEHKEGPAKTLVQLLREMDLVEKVLVQSFDWKWLEEFHRLEPRTLVAALGPEHGVPNPGSDKFFSALEKTGASMVHWSGRKLRVEDCRAIRGRGYMTCVYTLNDELSMLGAPAMGVQLVTTDRPARLRSLILDFRIPIRHFEGDR